MARQPKMWWRKSHKCWYVTHNGRKERLDPDKKTAQQMFYDLVGRNDPSSNGPVLDLLAAYLNWSKVNHKPTTFKWYKYACDSFGASLSEGFRVRDLRPYDLTKWLDTNFPAQGEVTATDNTRHNMASGVMRAFNWAVKQGIIRESPLANVTKAPKTPRAAYFMPDQWKKLIAFVPDELFRDFLTLLRHTGCRPQEARIVEARFFHPDQQCWIIPKKSAKGKKEDRYVLLDDVALEICKRWAIKFPTGPMFRNTRGKPWTKDAINCRFQRLKTKLSFHASAYVCRHTFVTDALVNGVGEATVAELAGHKDKRMILSVYQHVGKRAEHLRDALKIATRDLPPMPMVDMEAPASSPTVNT
jgi:integrase